MLLLVQILHIVSAILLIVTILVQQRSSGLSSAFGGGGEVAYSVLRGPEKFLHYFTVLMVIVYLGSAVAFPFVQ